jgi:hypothetical protein
MTDMTLDKSFRFKNNIIVVNGAYATSKLIEEFVTTVRSNKTAC